MIIIATIEIESTRATVWSLISKVEEWPRIIRGVKNIEVVQRPSSGVSGLRWKETRLLFDKPETVEKWVTESVEGESYTTVAEQDGFRFTTTFGVSDTKGGVLVTSAHRTDPQTMAARLRSVPLFLFKGVIRKALLEDLNDVREAALEQHRGQHQVHQNR